MVPSTHVCLHVPLWERDTIYSRILVSSFLNRPPEGRFRKPLLAEILPKIILFTPFSMVNWVAQYGSSYFQKHRMEPNLLNASILNWFYYLIHPLEVVRRDAMRYRVGHGVQKKHIYTVFYTAHRTSHPAQCMRWCFEDNPSPNLPRIWFVLECSCGYCKIKLVNNSLIFRADNFVSMKIEGATIKLKFSNFHISMG